MVVQVGIKLLLLLVEVGEVDEESRAHVALHGLDLLVRGRPVAAAQEVAVLEEAASADLLRVLGGDQLFVQVVQRLFKVPVHRLGHDGGVEVLRHGRGVGRVALVVQEQRVEHDVKAVYGEFVLPSHRMYKLEFHCFGPIITYELKS